MPILGKIPGECCYHNNSSPSKDKSGCRDGENSSVCELVLLLCDAFFHFSDLWISLLPSYTTLVML